MRTILFLCAILLSLATSCKDDPKSKEGNEAIPTEESIEPRDKLGGSVQDQPIDEIKTEPDKEITTLTGQYIKNDHPEDINCNCYCLDIQMNAVSELCLKESELYINGRFEKDGNNINLFYSGKSSRTQNNNIPWNEFERTKPIAVISPTDEGLELDWKGFSIDGEIAVDYALYGKKTLEGTYKKK